MEENFLQAAQGLNFIEDYSIRRKTLDRTVFRQGTFHEFFCNSMYQNPEEWAHYGNAVANQIIPQSVVKVEADEYAEYLIIWNLELAAGFSELIIVHPFANGQLIGHGSHAVELRYPWVKTNNVRQAIILESPPTGGNPSIEDPFLPGATIKARAEHHQGQTIVTLDQGVFWIGLVWDGPKDISSAASGARALNRIFPGEDVLFSKCSLSVNKVNR